MRVEEVESPKQQLLRMLGRSSGRRGSWADNCKQIEWNQREKVYVIPLASFGDSYGTMLHRSNAAYLESKYPEIVKIEDGPYSDRTACFTNQSLNSVDRATFDLFKQEIEGLANYPVLDDDWMAEMERDEIDRYWEDDGYKEFRKELVGSAGSLEAQIAATKIVADDLWTLVSDHDNGDTFTIEDGGSVYFDAEKAAQSVSDDEIMALIGRRVSEEDFSAMVRNAKWSALEKRLSREFFKAVTNMYSRYDPSVVAALNDLDDEALFRLIDHLAKKARTDWKLIDADTDPVMVTLEDQDLVDMAALIRPSDFRNLRPESPNQTRFKFAESVVNQML